MSQQLKFVDIERAINGPFSSNSITCTLFTLPRVSRYEPFLVNRAGV